MPDLAPAEQSRASWREQAVARRLDPDKARAEERVQRFLDAGLELMCDSTSGADFTIQEVVEKSGQSLRSFYQYFGGKQELLLALFEETVLSTTQQLRALMDEENSAADRLHRFAVEYYRVCRPARRPTGSGRATPALTEFALHLLTAQPAEAARAFVPVVQLFEQVLAEATEEGAVRTDLRPRRVAGVVLEAIMFNAFSRTIAGAPPDEGDAAEELWDVVMNGIGTGKA